MTFEQYEKAVKKIDAAIKRIRDPKVKAIFDMVSQEQSIMKSLGMEDGE